MKHATMTVVGARTRLNSTSRFGQAQALMVGEHIGRLGEKIRGGGNMGRGRAVAGKVAPRTEITIKLDFLGRGRGGRFRGEGWRGRTVDSLKKRGNKNERLREWGHGSRLAAPCDLIPRGGRDGKREQLSCEQRCERGGASRSRDETEVENRRD